MHQNITAALRISFAEKLNIVFYLCAALNSTKFNFAFFSYVNAKYERMITMTIKTGIPIYILKTSFSVYLPFMAAWTRLRTRLSPSILLISHKSGELSRPVIATRMVLLTSIMLPRYNSGFLRYFFG